MNTYPQNDYRNYLEHSAKGQTWSNHKYIAIKNGRYIYPEDNQQGWSKFKASKTTYHMNPTTVVVTQNRREAMQKQQDTHYTHQIKKKQRIATAMQQLMDGYHYTHSYGAKEKAQTNRIKKWKGLNQYLHRKGDFNKKTGAEPPKKERTEISGVKMGNSIKIKSTRKIKPKAK